MLAFPQTPSRRHRQRPSQQVYALPTDHATTSHKVPGSIPTSALTSEAVFPTSTDLQALIVDGLPSDFHLTSRPETLHFDDLLQSSQLPELMQSDAWLLGTQFTPSSTGRFSHHRESSLSSLGSAGPASPYAHPTSNPHIAVTDSTGDALRDLEAHEPFYQQFPAKLAPTAHDGITTTSFPSFNMDHHAEMRYPAPVQMQRPRTERSLLPAAELSVNTGRSHPNSVASSVAGDSPATPLLGEPEADDRRRKAAFSVPKLDRTMTDIYSDELYSPNFAITSASPVRQAPGSGAAANDVFAQRLQAANSQHLSAAHSPASDGSRGRSPFRQGSPLAFATSHDFAVQPRLGSAARAREQGQAAQDMRAVPQQQQQQQTTQKPAFKKALSTLQTISPKDAILEFHETDNDANFPLFPQAGHAQLQHFASSESATGRSVADPATSAGGLQGPLPGSASADVAAFNNYLAQGAASVIQLPQHYPFISRSRSDLSSPPQFTSSESGSRQSTPQGLMAKPLGATADGGTYTCTYHGCTLRFETPALLQKHKREGHRQGQGLVVPRKFETGMTSALLNSQAGPHRCDRINPSTGKPCGTIFSRPYDLTRHEDTIHNARKQKVRCDLCTEDKTFSRADALTRHYRVVHPDVDFPAGKHRRRVPSDMAGE